jgi:hypothetical protein
MAHRMLDLFFMSMALVVILNIHIFFVTVCEVLPSLYFCKFLILYGPSSTKMVYRLWLLLGLVT